MDNKPKVKFSEDILNLVVARLEAMPSNVEISIGGGGSFTVKELIEKVTKGDEVGQKIVEMHLNYLRSLGNLPTPKNNDPSNN